MSYVCVVLPTNSGGFILAYRVIDIQCIFIAVINKEHSKGLFIIDC